MAAKNLPRTVTHSQKIEVVVKITHKVREVIAAGPSRD
jgi:hypothetical protein